MPAYIPYADTGYFSQIVLDYLAQVNHLKPFYGLPPQPESFAQQMEAKSSSFTLANRTQLHHQLKAQHANLASVHPQVNQNIDLLLQPNTFTVTTGHQLCLFTGPLYFIYKILTVIRTCEELRERHPEANFVPLFWMATEDHDFEEVNHFRFLGNTYAWQTGQKGAVGRFGLSGIEEMIGKLPEHLPLFEQPYLQNQTLAGATRELVHNLFGEYGVVSLDADVPELKQRFSEITRQELLHGIGQRKVNEATGQLAAYYKVQVSPRPINLFYLKDGLRERIECVEGNWRVVNTEQSFSEEEILQELDKHPDRFSPNVILRPVYQEILLPNLAYVGGGAEVAYWLELKSLFDHFTVPFPILMLRNSALYVPASLNKRIKKLGLKLTDLFKDEEKLKNQVLKNQQGYSQVTLEKQQTKLKEMYAELEAMAKQTDPTLLKSVAAARHRAQKGVDLFGKKLNRAAEKRYDTVLGQLADLSERLFPGGGLQERKECAATFMAMNSGFIGQIKQALDPFRQDFTIVQELPDAD